jgi:hypothetical protein
MTPFVFGEWLPDQPSSRSNGILEATNVYPGARGYRPVGSFAQYVPAGPTGFKGAGAFTAPYGENIIIGGTTTTLYRVTSGAWSALGSGFNVPSQSRWRFAQFGGLAIATNGSDPMQKIDLTNGTVAVLGSDPEMMPPTTKMLAVVKDFLVGGVINGQGNQIAWSAINDAEEWNFANDQSDYQIMPSGGDVNGILGGEFGIILQRNRITRMEYVGGNNIFTINEISNNFGCVTPHSVIQHGTVGCFLSDNGFMMWTGSDLKPIGNERIDRYFLSTYGKASWPLMSAAVDIKNQVFCWAMPATATVTGRIFCYHWQLDRWTVIEQPAQIIFSGVTRSISITEVDTDLADESLLNAVGAPSFDDPKYRGGDNAFYVINDADVLGRMIGPSMAATLTSPDQEIHPGRQTLLTLANPETDAIEGVTVSVASRARLGDPVTYNTYSTLRPNGDMPVRERGRYQRFKVQFEEGAAWTYMQAVQPDGTYGARQ